MKDTFHCLLVLTFSLVCHAYDWSTNPGDGSPENPYQISEPNHLTALSSNASLINKHFILMNDIVFSPDINPQHVFTAALMAFSGNGFSGTFDGNGHVIHNLRIDGGTGADELALFSRISASGRVINLGLENVFIRGRDFLGGVCARNKGMILRCYAKGVISGAYYSDCLGGICGIAESYSVITDCYSMVSISNGNQLVGCLCGSNGGTISFCYAIGPVHGDPKGGICGFNTGTVTDTYWDRQSSGAMVSSGGQSRTTSQMKSATTFVGWDNDSWIIKEAVDYPRLAWEQLTGYTEITTSYPARTYNGSGTAQDPFVLTTPADIICMSKRVPDWTMCFVLASNVNLAGIMDYFPPAEFRGSFDGAGFSIDHFIIDAQVIGNRDYLGLFGRLSSSGRVQNVTVNGSISGSAHGQWLGIICGYNWGTISNCQTAGSLSGTGFYSDYLGGICGENYGSISFCSSSTNVSSSYGSYLGGLCGSTSGTVWNCRSTGSITNLYGLGGFCGLNTGIVLNCYSTGHITGLDKVAGFCGQNIGTISNCYSTGHISSSRAFGGFCADNSSGSITNCFWDSLTSGIPDSSLSEMIGLSTDLMKQQASFTNWDFLGESANGQNEIWRMCADGVDYPRLSWQFAQNGDFACDDGIDLADLLALAEHWLMTEANNPINFSYAADANADTQINIEDLAALSSHWP